MALLATKKKIQLATKGHKLLKEKRDALIGEFFAIVDELKTLRKQVDEAVAEAFKALILAQALNGAAEVRRAAETVPSITEVTVSTRAVMGVRVPVFSLPTQTGAGYSLISSSLELDEAARRFQSLLSSLVKVAELEATMARLAEEIKKTKRKVNALEQILLPRLNDDKTYITMRLEEMERENFGRLKVIKGKLSK
ncbi:V-type ATP synthase subunit D [Candidatus Woesearchaeota archaeon]|nr:MAG: V-type ATP synthase subunit D [Candidatus Woesearchaeota archaeon]